MENSLFINEIIIASSDPDYSRHKITVPVILIL